MPETLPSIAVLAELEARQEEALGKLTELEQQVERALAEFTAVSKRAADLRVGEAKLEYRLQAEGKRSAEATRATIPFTRETTTPAKAGTPTSIPAVKVA